MWQWGNDRICLTRISSASGIPHVSFGGILIVAPESTHFRDLLVWSTIRPITFSPGHLLICNHYMIYAHGFHVPLLIMYPWYQFICYILHGHFTGGRCQDLLQKRLQVVTDSCGELHTIDVLLSQNIKHVQCAITITFICIMHLILVSRWVSNVWIHAEVDVGII